jgi:predicted MFS family arabinose efflux permease
VVAVVGFGGMFAVYSYIAPLVTEVTGMPRGAIPLVLFAYGVGSILGTAAGSRLQGTTPDRLVLISAGIAAAVTVVAAFMFNLPMAALVAGVAAVTNALGKVALDAIIQREVPESLRASAFARSETWLQLSWVFGGAIGIALPPIGWLGFTVAAALLVIALGLLLWSLHRQRSAQAPTTPLGEQWG